MKWRDQHHSFTTITGSLFGLCHSAAFGIILVNNPDTSLDPSILKVGANQGYIVAFGKYPQDSDGSGGYLTKPIAWRILDSENSDHNSNLSPVKAGETQTPEEAAINGDAKGLTLFAQKILDNTKRFGDNADWRNSDVRSFLNEGYTRPSDPSPMSFYTNDDVFTSAERAAIANTTITTLDIWGTVEQGSEPKIRAANPKTRFDSIDHIFLLSSDEMAGDIDKTDGDAGSATPASTAYGFDKEYQSYYQAKNTRAMATDFALHEGVWRCDDGCCEDSDPNCDNEYHDAGGVFWLRSPGDLSDDAALVGDGGRVFATGDEGGDAVGVRPALLTNKASIICLMDSTVSPWDGVGSAWTPVAHTSPPATIPTWVGANPVRSDDRGVDHIMRMILKTEDLSDTIYTINAISPGSISLNAVASFTEQLGSFDMAAIKVPDNANKRQGDFEEEGYYTFKYPYVFQVKSIEENTTTNLSVDFPSDTNRFMVFRSNHSGIAPSEPVYDTTYGSAALEIDLTTTPPTLLTADAGLVINSDVTIAFSREITSFKHNLTLNGGELHLKGPLDFSQGTVSINSGTLNISHLSSTDIITFPQGTRATSAFNIVPSDNWSQFIRNLDLSDPLDEVTEFITASRNRLAGAATVNTIMDLVANSVASELNSGAETSSIMALGANASKVTTGSHVKVYGGSAIVGVSRGFNHVLVGVFAEGGLSHFDTYDIVKVSSGNTNLAGLGAMVKLDSKAAYLTGMVHGGILKTKAAFKTNTSFLGAYTELGWHIGSYLDSYVRYSYSRTGAIEETLANLSLSVDPTVSHRGRFGVKLMLSNSAASPYLSVAFEREFKGDTKGATVLDDANAAPTTKGNSGIVEAGFQLELAKNWFTKVRAEWSFGRRQGVSSGVGVEYRL